MSEHFYLSLGYVPFPSNSRYFKVSVFNRLRGQVSLQPRFYLSFDTGVRWADKETSSGCTQVLTFVLFGFRGAEGDDTPSEKGRRDTGSVFIESRTPFLCPCVECVTGAPVGPRMYLRQLCHHARLVVPSTFVTEPS